MEALKYVNLTKSAGLMGFLGVYLGMRVRITKKLLPPMIVQEATGEVVGIVFHPKEKFNLVVGMVQATYVQQTTIHVARLCMEP